MTAAQMIFQIAGVSSAEVPTRMTELKLDPQSMIYNIETPSSRITLKKKMTMPPIGPKASLPTS